MRERGLEPEWSPAALAEAAAIERAANDPDRAVHDLRALAWCSIDNDDSRDLDQLTVAAPDDRILVAIADVDALVKRNTALDAHARMNTTSVYTAAGVFPMLPEKLSTDLTSLNEHALRLAIVVDMTVDDHGHVAHAEVYRAFVQNKAKLTYDEVAAWLDGVAPAPARLAAVPGLVEQLRLQDRVAARMRALRFERGALDLESQRSRAVFADGTLTDLAPDRKNRAKTLIEDFMIAANSATARFLEARGIASMRRVLRSPERWDRIVALAAELGERLAATPDRAALAAFLERRRAADPHGFPELSLTVIKLIGRGEYALERPGDSAENHFGLAVADYAHATAPNRRFPDLVTQRLIKAALAGAAPPYAADELSELARHCTEQENDAAKVERQVQKSAAALLLAGRAGARFDAIVTGASAKGTWVRIEHPSVEGRVVRGATGLDVGDRVRVRLVAADVERGFIDFTRE